MPSDKTVMGAGYKLTFSTGSISKEVQKAVLRGLKDSAQQYYDAVIESISLDDHTLAELRKLGHPYAVQDPGPPVHPDDRMVHTQSGELKASIKKTEVIQVSGKQFTVKISSDSPTMPYLIYGTSKMRPRRFHELAYEKIKDKIWEPLKVHLKNVKARTKPVP